MPNYSADLENLFRKAPQAQGRLEAVSFEFGETTLLYVRDYKNRMLSLSAGGSLVEFTAAGFKVDEPSISESGQQVFTVTFPSAGTDLYRTVDIFANNNLFIEVKVSYFQYFINGKVVDTDPAYVLTDLYAFNIAVNAKADVNIQASTDNLKTYTVGDLYTYDKFYALRTL